MSSTPEQESAVERLYENEALIDNLIADVAKPVLTWAEQQIMAGVDAEAIFAAVRAVNESDPQDATTALATAQQTLAPAAVEASTPATPVPAPAEDQAASTSPVATAASVTEEQTPTPIAVEATTLATPVPAPAEDQAAKMSPVATVPHATDEKAQPSEEPKLPQNAPQVSAPTPAIPVEQPVQLVDKPPTPAPAYTPIVASPKSTNKPQQASAPHKTDRAFLRRLTGWFKTQNK